MKKYFFFALFGFLVLPQFASAQKLPCSSGDRYDYLTGVQCSTSIIRGCTAGTAFSPLTGESCAFDKPNSGPSLIVMSPNGGEIWNQDVEQRISWLYGSYGGSGMTGTERVTINLVFPDGFVCNAGESYANTMWFNLFPNSSGCSNDTSRNLRAGGQFKVRLLVTDASGKQIANDDSNAPFTILGPTVQASGKFWIDKINLKDRFKSNEPISFTGLVGKEPDGTLARQEEGFNVQWSVLTTRIPAIGESIYGQSFNANYDPVNSTWSSGASTTLPPGQYEMQVGLYCGLIKSSCTTRWKSNTEATVEKLITVTSGY